MNIRCWKKYALILAIMASISFSLAPVAKAQTRTASGTTPTTTASTSSSTTSSSANTTSSATSSQSEPDRNAQGYTYSSGYNPLLGTSYNTLSFWPDYGIGQAGYITNSTNPITGTSSSGSVGMTYAGGLPVYTGAGSPGANLNYGAMTGVVNSMSGVNSYNPAAAYGYGYAAAGGLYGGYGGGLYGGYGGGLYGGGYNTTSSYGGLYGGYNTTSTYSSGLYGGGYYPAAATGGYYPSTTAAGYYPAGGTGYPTSIGGGGYYGGSYAGYAPGSSGGYYSAIY